MNTLRIRDDDLEKIKKEIFKYAPKEAAAFALGGVFKNNSGWHLAVREIIIPDENDYTIQEELLLQVSSAFINKIIGRAE